ncbi:polysaccharide deacetylase family protein [Paenibacillus koleovorans]|uniref:polysaccharide deacetylase family protein n=1 Tax=Paenibacillus koleovorans TaxID=121608 RepID=UPI000FDAC5FA|nr:polysaccharide deacetylase family protein [Paenibacillus koleovorans]
MEKRIRYDMFPGGRTKALTLSYDDGKEQDRRLVDKLNEYGLKGTFHLNSGFLGNERYIRADEVASLFQGHEVSAHTVNHPFLDQTSADQIVRQLTADREALERLVGYPVRGMSYPFGAYNELVLSLLPAIGIEYARTVESHGKFQMPSDFLRWHPTCHHHGMVEQAEAFVSLEQRHTRMALLYVWGHSYEFDNNQNWELLDRFGEKVAGREDIWYATNAEILAYMQALQRLRFSIDSRIVHNPSAIPVWIRVDTDVVEIGAGAVVQLD